MLQKAASPAIDGDSFGLVIERTALNDFDVHPWQPRGGACCIALNSPIRRAASPWSLVGQ